MSYTIQQAWQAIVSEGTLSPELTYLIPKNLNAALTKAVGTTIALPKLPLPPVSNYDAGGTTEYHKQILYFGYIIPSLINEGWFRWDPAKQIFYYATSSFKGGQQDHAQLDSKIIPDAAKGFPNSNFQMILIGYDRYYLPLYIGYPTELDLYGNISGIFGGPAIGAMPCPFLGNEEQPVVSDQVIVDTMNYLPFLEQDPARRAQILALTYNQSGSGWNTQTINFVGRDIIWGTVAIGGAVAAYGAVAGTSAATTEVATTTAVGDSTFAGIAEPVVNLPLSTVATTVPASTGILGTGLSTGVTAIDTGVATTVTGTATAEVKALTVKEVNSLLSNGGQVTANYKPAPAQAVGTVPVGFFERLIYDFETLVNNL